MSARMPILVISLFIYVLILISFNKARKRYSGGRIGEVIKLIIITVILLFISDYVRMFDGYIPEDLIFIIQTAFKTMALAFLAYGGNKIAQK
jgi:hypothetical protein